MTAKVTLGVKAPIVPNFVRLIGHETEAIPLGSLSDETIRDIVKDWTHALWENVNRQRAEGGGEG